MIILTNNDIQIKAIQLVREIVRKNFSDGKHHLVKIYGVPRGGIPVAYLLKGHFLEAIVVDDPKEANFIVDDIIDSGSTKVKYHEKYNKPFYALIDKEKDNGYDDWIVFPWEKMNEETPIEDNLERVCQYLKGDIEIENRQAIAHRLQDIMEKLLAT